MFAALEVETRDLGDAIKRLFGNDLIAMICEVKCQVPGIAGACS